MIIKIGLLAAAAIISTALFLLMGYLITPSNALLPAPGEDTHIVITRNEREETSIHKKRQLPQQPKQDVVPPPPVIPKPSLQDQVDGGGLLVTIPDQQGSMGDFNTNTDRRATPIVRFPPQYPQGPLQRGTEGWVLVEFTITATGGVTDMTVVDADPGSVFNRATLRALKRWKYQPKIENGKAVAQFNMREIFRFEIEQS